VIVAVVAVRVVEVVPHEEVHVVSMGNALVTTLRSVEVTGVVAIAEVVGGAGLRMRGVDLEHVLVHMVPVRVVQMTVVQVVDVVAVRHRGMPAAGLVAVGVIGMSRVVVHVDQCAERPANRQTAESRKHSHVAARPARQWRAAPAVTARGPL
jgi:hypothetical protein